MTDNPFSSISNFSCASILYKPKTLDLPQINRRMFNLQSAKFAKVH